MDNFLAEIRVFPYNFAPKGWAICDGALLPISQNTALFSLLGTTFGGDGRTTFALPNLLGQVPVHAGQGNGPGLSPYPLGQSGGSETVTLTSAQMPAHAHPVAAVAANDATTASTVPTGATVFGQSQARARSTGYVTVGAQSALAMNPAVVAAA